MMEQKVPFAFSFTAALTILMSQASAVFADEKPNPAVVEEALRKTQELLRDPSAREKIGKQTSEGREAMNQAESLGGSTENTEEIYDLAADIFADLVHQTNGDPDKIKELLKKAQKNPEDFAKHFSDSQKAKLKEISKHSPTM